MNEWLRVEMNYPLASKFWKARSSDLAVIFTHNDAGVRFVWVDGTWLEQERRKRQWCTLPYTPNIDRAYSSEVALEAGWRWLEGSEEEAKQSEERAHV